MKLLAEISEDTLGFERSVNADERFIVRQSARAILLNTEGNMAVQHLQNYGFHKLPGGGVDEGESYAEACVREIKEEVGCEAELHEVIGATIEYRYGEKRIQVSQCFEARVVGQVGVPHLEEGEIEEGQVTLWLPPATVLEKMRTDIPKKFEGHFILKREMAFLEAFLHRS